MAKKPVAPTRRVLYALRVPAHVADLIRGLHPQLKRKLRAAIETIAAAPRGGKALKDDLAGLWSFRVGKFRIVYRIAAGRCVELVACGPRERIYEETYRLIMRRK
ncbi:MAG: type II toxin-antitoxin system RelE/ParE family toxin [Pseudomonadota bacterium]